MGEVYRARDETLGRDVAVKILPAEVAHDPERLGRFRREAQLLASLNHPHIGAIYGLETAEERTFLVLELVEGEDLAKRLERGSLPVDEALTVARQMAEALEEAHEKGIIHRDLKPSNLKVTPDGMVKVLDFGLAKAYAGDMVDASSPELSHSPTLARTGTAVGVILGTAAYMSPEQARGKAVDRRADIWAFGAVLYEMLTGKRLFTGETVTDIIAAVVKEEPRWDELPPETPAPVRRLLRRCLSKDRKARLQHIGDAKLEIEDALGAPPDTDEVTAPVGIASRPTRQHVLPWGLAAVLFLMTVALLLRVPFVGRAERIVRASIPPPEGSAFHLNLVTPGPVVLSLDGSKMAFSARGRDGQVLLYVRSLDAAEAHALSGTEGAQYPFWSADGRSIAYFADGKLKKIEASGGPPLTLCDAQNGKGGSWSREGVILFAPTADGPIHRVSDVGGESTPVTELDLESGFNSHRHPRFLPDGRHFLYLARSSKAGEESVVRLASVEGGTDRELVRSPAAAMFASGHLLFMRETVLMGRPFDPDEGELFGEAFPLAEDVMLLPGAAHAVYTASENGVLSYLAGKNVNEAKLEWFDRQGTNQGQMGDLAAYQEIFLSPDGKSAVAGIIDLSRGTADLWIFEIARELRTRFTFDPGEEASPVWSPDGNTLTYASNRKGHYDLYRKSVGGSGEEELILESESDKYPTGWSPDGKVLAYTQRGEGTSWDLWMLPLSGEGEPFPFLQTSFDEPGGVFSPDGRWLAYNSDESGRWEVYVTAFPGPGRKWQVSTEGGVYPLWRQDGEEIVYQQLDGSLISVEVTGRSDSFVVGAAKALFQRPPPIAGVILFAASPDAQRFLAATPTETQSSNPLTLVLNWTAEVEKNRR